MYRYIDVSYFLSYLGFFENDVTITLNERIKNEYEERSAPKKGSFLAIKVKYYTTTRS